MDIVGQYRHAVRGNEARATLIPELATSEVEDNHFGIPTCHENLHFLVCNESCLKFRIMIISDILDSVLLSLNTIHFFPSLSTLVSERSNSVFKLDVTFVSSSAVMGAILHPAWIFGRRALIGPSHMDDLSHRPAPISER